MKNTVVTMFLLLALVITSMPVAVGAQTRARVAQTSRTTTYYEDDTVIFRSKKVFVSSVDIHVGRSPEVPGGLTTAPAADEEDVALDKRILVATKTAGNNIYIGYLNPTVNGKQIYVRRKIASKKIVAIKNCGNWTRELGADYSFVCDTTPGPCVPGKETEAREESISPDGKTKTEIVTTTDGCVTRIEKTITNTVAGPTEYVDKEVCKLGSLDPTPLVNISGKVDKSFKVKDAITQFTPEQQAQIISNIGMEKIHGLIILQGACDTERHILKVFWFTKKGGGWNWLSFFVGVGVGVFAGIIIKRTRNTPAIKTNNTQLPPRNPIDGSGSTSGGVIGTRRRRP